ncbi:hypothetical protein [Pseudonocardia sediminis]|nr:hypothetical protein [Pseudonocardia sediminis]
MREVEQRLHGALGPGRLDAARADLDAMSRALGGDHPAGHA